MTCVVRGKRPRTNGGKGAKSARQWTVDRTVAVLLYPPPIKLEQNRTPSLSRKRDKAHVSSSLKNPTPPPQLVRPLFMINQGIQHPRGFHVRSTPITHA